MKKDRRNRSEKYQAYFNEIGTDFTSEFGRNIVDDNNGQVSISKRLLCEELLSLEEKLAKAFLPAIKPLLSKNQYEVSEATLLNLTQTEIGKLLGKNQTSVLKCFQGNIVYEDGVKKRYGGITRKILKNINSLTVLMPIIEEIDAIYDEDLPIRMPFYRTIKRLLLNNPLYKKETKEEMVVSNITPKQIQDMRLLKSQGLTNVEIGKRFNLAQSTVYKYTKDVSKPKPPPHPATQMNYTKPLDLNPPTLPTTSETPPGPLPEVKEINSGNLPAFNSTTEELIDDYTIQIKLPEYLHQILEQIVSEKNKDRYRYYDVSIIELVRMAVIDYIKKYEQNQCIVKS